MPLLQKCCCCFNLEIGGVILAWFGLVGSTFKILACGILLANFKRAFDGMPVYNESSEALSISLPVLIAFAAIGLIAYLCLLVGSSRRIGYLVLPSLILDMIILVSTSVTALTLIAMTLTSGSTGIGIYLLIGELISFGLQLYWWLCGFSLFQHLRELEGVTLSTTVDCVVEPNHKFNDVENARLSIHHLPESNTGLFPTRLVDVET